MNPPPALVVGLGNPGEKYARTRHNVGFWFVERLAQQHGALFSAKRNFYGDLAEIPGCRLLRPTTFMNHSGRAVAAVHGIIKFYRRPLLSRMMKWTCRRVWCG